MNKNKIVFFILLTYVFLPITNGQTVVDSTRGVNSWLEKQTHLFFFLNLEGYKPRLFVNSKKHTIKVEDANNKYSVTHLLDSVCNFEKYPANCFIEDSSAIGFKNKEIMDWDNSIMIYDKTKKIKSLENKALLSKIYGKLDSLIVSKTAFLDSDNEQDLIVLKRGNEDDNYYQLDVYLNRKTYYLKIISQTFSKNLEYLYFANFTLQDLPVYFYIENSYSAPTPIFEKKESDKPVKFRYFQVVDFLR